MSKVLVIGGGDGLGGLCQAFQCGKAIKDAGYEIDVKISASDQVYKPLEYLFSDKFHMEQIPIEYSQNHRLLNDEYLMTDLTAGYDDWCYICPDLTYKYFNYKKYNILPNTIKGLRLLTHKLKPQNEIYLALNTTTENYNYQYSHHLIRGAAYVLPDFKIHVPVLDKWSELSVKQIDLPTEIPENVIIHRNPDFIQQLDIMSRCLACICVDNGASHISFGLGQLRILLDPHIYDLPWVIRWREDMADSVPLATFPGNLCKLLHTNIKYPETQLLNKRDVIDVLNVEQNPDWKQRLILKY